MTAPLARVLCCRRVGGDEAQVDVSGWTATASRLLLWLGTGSGSALEAAKRRREISLVAECILQRYEENWDEIATKLETLLTDGVTGFAFLEADSGNIHVLTREPIAALVLDQSGVRQLTLVAAQALSIGVNQAGVVSSVDAIDRMRPGVEKLSTEIYLAEEIVARIEGTCVELLHTRSAPAADPRSGMIVGVLSRYP